MIYDVTTYNGEADLFDLRYNILKDYVDEFIVVEFDRTFSGSFKESSFPSEQYPGVTHHFYTEDTYGKYFKMAQESPNTTGAAHWTVEFMQKESIKDALTHLKDDDIVFIGDVDEIWDPGHDWKMDALEPDEYTYANGTGKIGLRVYTYYLNNRSSEKFYGTLVGQYKYIKNECLNHLRSNPNASKCEDAGWHFTSMGGPEALRKKLTDSYTEESYATPGILGGIDSRYGDRDFLDRGFTYTIDESEWPQYLKDNREKYAHLLR